VIKINILLKRMIKDRSTIEEVSLALNIDRSTLYRKLNSNRFYISEVVLLKDTLKLSENECNDIFFNNNVAK